MLSPACPMLLSTGANEPYRPGKEEFLDELDVLIDSKEVITNQKTTLQLAPPVISMETKLASTSQKSCIQSEEVQLCMISFSHLLRYR